MKRTAVSLMLVLLMGVLSLPASGSTKGSDFFSVENRAKEPIEITAGTASARNIPDGVESVFKNSVTVRQGGLWMECDEMKLVWDEKAAGSRAKSEAPVLPRGLQSLSGLRTITASGHVKVSQDQRRAVADKAVFDNRKRTITLTGGPPRIWHGGDVLQAPRIIIWLDENRVEMLPEEGRSRSDKPQVFVRINPDRNTPEMPDRKTNSGPIRIRIHPDQHKADGSRDH